MTKYLTVLFLLVISYQASAQSSPENTTEPLNLENLNGFPDSQLQPVMPYPDDLSIDGFGMPSFAFGVFGKNGELLDLFGPETPHRIQGDSVRLLNYDLPEGANIKIISSGDAVAAYQSSISDATKSAIQNTIDAISDGTNYLAEKLCEDKARPTRVALNFNISVKVPGVEGNSASEVEWNLKELCDRYNE